MKDAIKRRLYQAAITIVASTGGGAALYTNSTPDKPSAAVLLSYELAQHFESGGKHIGKPYIDSLGVGKPLTVCAGITEATGIKIDPNRYYTEDECKAMELPILMDAERLAVKKFTHWDSYNVWVRASLIDVVYNVPSATAPTTGLMQAAAAGDVIGMCKQMPRWVYGTVNGVKVRLNGLIDRRTTTEELCAEWGRDGHFSFHITEVADASTVPCQSSHGGSFSGGARLWCGYRYRD